MPASRNDTQRNSDGTAKGDVPDPLPGATIQALFAAAGAHLDAAASAIDAINVYPVPDGDTGSNMSATLREAIAAGDDLDDTATAGERIAAIARGGLYGARGNSGVILSQALRGFSEGTKERDVIDARALAQGLRQAAERAYGAVAKPKEGTMLTVLRAAGEAATTKAEEMPKAGEGQPCIDVLNTAVRGAEEAEARTIEELPALKEAGVTDSGGEGICTILRGLRAGLLGEPVPETPPDLGQPLTATGQADGHEDDGYGYCTEFLLERGEQEIDVDRLREALSTSDTSSVVVVGDERLARVHIHTEDADALLAEAREWGKLSRVKVDDMSEQASRFRASGSGATDKLAVLALSRGKGFDGVFESLGAMVTDLGETVKPAAGDIARIAASLRVPDVIVLPNHKNVMMSAEQAVELSDATLHVVPSHTLAAGVAALVAYDPAAPAKDNVAAMTRAMGTIRSVEVTIAAADRTSEGIDIKRGDALALVDTTLTATAATQEEALVQGLRDAGAEDAEIISVYFGLDAAVDVADLEKQLVDAFPDAEIEVIEGGQTLYGYVASVER